MGWGWGWALLWGLLGTAPALRCPLCDVTGCRPVSCPSPRAVCRRTTLTALRGGLELLKEESGCDVTGPPDVVITFRSHGEVVTLREERWGEEPEGSHAHGEAPPPPGNSSGPAPLLCPTCDVSCSRPLPVLPCPRPRDRCIDVISRGPAGEGEGRLRGCGQAGPCRGLLAFDSGRGRRVALQCCERGECELESGPPSGLRCWGYDGPAPSHDPAPSEGPAPSDDPAPSEGPAPLRCGWGRGRCVTAWGRGPSGEPWLLRGCATPEWCETPVGLGGLWGGSGGDPMGRGGSMGRGGDPLGLRCCRGHFCNALPGDPSPPPPNAAPPPLWPLPPLLLLLLAAPQV